VLQAHLANAIVHGDGLQRWLEALGQPASVHGTLAWLLCC
jgi:hypothetical protein